jgi:FtsP/CotA-like multicopper oxidase with cupredoxin domain
MHTHHQSTSVSGSFPTDPEGLPAAEPTRQVHLADGDHFHLRISPVVQRINDALVRRLAYGGSVPGPTLRVKQGSEVVVRVTNDGDVDATVHWHGLRLENRYDGVPHETQKPIAVGDSFTYRVRFPDEGLYWYHPHLREDYAQDMGLYGNIVVEPNDPEYWPPVDREVVLTVDDVLLEDGRVAGYARSGPDHVAMGRFGNVLLVNGQPDWFLDVRRGEVVRFYLTNTANTRVFNLAIPGARMKLVGGDSGRYERQTFIDEVLIAPSERAVVDVLFDQAGEATFEHRTPGTTYRLGRVAVHEGPVHRSAAADFDVLRSSPDLEGERARIDVEIERPPDKVLALVAEMIVDASAATPDDIPWRFACPMNPEIVSVEPGRCPVCGMKLLPIEAVPAAIDLIRSNQAGGHHGSDHHAGGSSHGAHAAGSIEWEDTMEAVNRGTNPANMRWMLVDRAIGKTNADIDWSFHVGDRVKIRLVNELDSDHPMHHPFHIHGAGRFVVLTRGDDVEPNLVWKDTVLVRTGEIVDILLDVTNPGLWMAHCHIAEHAESGMMFSFRVERDRPGGTRD